MKREGKKKGNLFGKVQDDREQQLQQQRQRRGKIYDGGGWAKQATRDARGRGGERGGRMNERRK